MRTDPLGEARRHLDGALREYNTTSDLLTILEARLAEVTEDIHQSDERAGWMLVRWFRRLIGKERRPHA